MSQPKRYDCTESWGMDECMAWMDERVDGRYVEYSDYAALAAENERLRKAGVWQPMETAPKDGTILISMMYHDPQYCDRIHMKFCYWSDAEKGWDGIANEIRKGRVIPVGWIYCPPTPTLSEAQKMLMRSNAVKEGRDAK